MCWVRNWDHRVGKTSPTSFSLMDEKHHMNKSIDCASMLTWLPIYAKCHKSPENSDESCLCTSGKVSQSRYGRRVFAGWVFQNTSFPSDLGICGWGRSSGLGKAERTSRQNENQPDPTECGGVAWVSRSVQFDYEVCAYCKDLKMGWKVSQGSDDKRSWV